MEASDDTAPDRPSTGLEARLRVVIDAIPEQVWSALPDGSIDFLNHRWHEYTGLPMEAGVGWGGSRAVHPQDLSRLLDEWRGSVASGNPLETEARFRRADGEYRWFLIRAVPLRDNEGNIIKWYGTSIDIGDRKKVEQMRAAQARHASLRADVGAAFSKSAALSVTLRECVEAIVRHLDAAFARIWILNPEEDTLQLQASAGMYTHLDGRHGRIPVGTLKIGLIAREKQAHLTNEVLTDPRVSDKDWARKEGMVAFAGYPLLVEDRVVGVVAMFARVRLSVDILDTLASVAGVIAQGIERKRTEEELHESQAQLRLRAEQALEETGQRLAAQSKALTKLTAKQARGSAGLDERLRAILETCARTLGVERASVWAFSQDRSTIRCLDLFECTSARHTADALLHRDRHPEYFAALERERLIDAGDARTHPWTCEFSDDYLVSNGIGAMLDVPLNQENVVVGVLCVEHVGGVRRWTADEQNFALAAANLIAVAAIDEDRRQALARLAASEARARVIVDTAHDAFVGMNSRGEIIGWNAQAEATFGWTRGEAIGRTVVDTIIPPSFREAHTAAMQRFLTTGEAPIVNKRLELRGLHRSGREFPIELTITSPMSVEDGFLFGGFLRDISDRHERDAQLRRAKESAEAATRAKSEFLANMSHELRTPLNGVLGYTQLLQRDRSLSPGQRDVLQAISKCGSHLLELITDILDLSKIEAGRVEIESVTTNLWQLTIDLKYVVAEAARRKGLRLAIEIAPDVPRRVVLDGRHLRQVLLNLLGNAIKFTEKGEVRLSIARAPRDQLAFDVIDTGIGMEPGDLEKIFEAFTQTPAGSVAGGTGLGLTISDRLIADMGGTLNVASVPGQGSRFFFALPLVAGDEPSDSAAVAPDDDSSLSDCRLADGEDVTALVADDSTVSRRILAALLESAGIRVITAAGGAEALELAGTHKPDIVFMDIRMADVDGLEVTRRLRAESTTAEIPVIAVTATAVADSRNAAYAAGCVDYLPKPIRAEALFAAVESHLGVRFVHPIETQPRSEPQLSDARERAGIATRLNDAAAVGDVTDLEALARQLGSGNEAQAVIGHRIAHLIGNFDFEGLRDLGRALGGSEPASGHD